MFIFSPKRNRGDGSEKKFNINTVKLVAMTVLKIYLFCAWENYLFDFDFNQACAACRLDCSN
jgi:hypothetical protein